MRINRDSIYVSFWVFLATGSLTFNSMFGSVAALMFIISGMVFVASDVNGTYQACKKNWILFLIPIWALTSALWSDIHVSAARSSVQLMLTTVFAVMIASKVKIDTFLRATTIAMTIAMLVSLFSSNTALNGLTGEYSLIGIFASKNFLATHAAMSICVALSLLLNQTIDKKSRALGLILLITSLLVLIRAQSFGAIVYVVFSIILSVVIVAYQNLDLHAGTRGFINKFLAASFICILAIMIYSVVQGTFDEFMYSIGKDPTLTGRTYIWERGVEIISGNPLFGVGNQSLFYLGNDPAEDIWELAHVTSGVGFNFHNMYVDVTVELGLIGLAMFVFWISAFIYHFQSLTKIILGSQQYFALLVFIYLFLQTFLEALWLDQFTIVHLFACMAWVYLQEKTDYEY